MPTIEQLNDLLLRNGFTDVASTSQAVVRLLTNEPSARTDAARIASAVDRSLAFRSRTSKKHIAQLIVAQLPAEKASDQSPNPRSVIFVATDLEFSAVTAELTGVRESLDPDGNWIARGTTPGGYPALVAKTGQGNVASTAVATAILLRWRPAVALFSGIGGGLQDQVAGSVVIADTVHDYESAEDGRRRGSRAKSAPANHRLVQIAGAIARRGVRGVPAISVQPIASGEKLVTDTSSDAAKWIRVVASDAAIVEMEGLGMMKSAANLEIPATVVRAVSDHKDDKSPELDAVNQPIAAHSAAVVSVALLDTYLKENSRG